MIITPLQGKALDSVNYGTARINVCEGSVRAGKTIGTLLDWIRFCRTGPAGNLLMVGRTERTVINNLVIPIQEMLGRDRVIINHGTGTVEICGRKVMVIGANNEQARTKIQGITLAGAYVDEAATLPESFWNMLVSRLSVAGAKLWATCNPEGPRHWFKINWLDKAKFWIDHHGEHHDRRDAFDLLTPDDPNRPLDLHRFSFTLDDNAHNLDPEYVASTKGMYSGLWYQRMIQGLWSMADGVIYDMFDPARHVVDDLPTMRQLWMGIDDGVNHPAAGILLGLGVDDCLYAVAEWAPPAGTPADRSKLLRRFVGEHGEPDYLFVDPAAASLKMQLVRDGFRNVANAANSHKLGIGTVASLLSTGQLRIHHSCTNLLGEIPGYVWDSKATQRGEDEPVKLDDDFADALRYSVTTSRAMWSPHLPTLHLPGSEAA